MIQGNENSARTHREKRLPKSNTLKLVSAILVNQHIHTDILKRIAAAVIVNILLEMCTFTRLKMATFRTLSYSEHDFSRWSSLKCSNHNKMTSRNIASHLLPLDYTFVIQLRQ